LTTKSNTGKLRADISLNPTMAIAKIQHLLSTRGNRLNLLIASSAALAIVGAGALLIATKASGFFAATESESATLATNATLVTDATASGGQAVQFNAPAGGGGGGGDGGGGGTSCSGAANHVPDGPDGTGTCWPGTNNTGIPAGTVLTSTSSCTITTANVVLDSKNFTCDLVVRAANVTVKNSKVNGQVVVDTDANNTWSLTIQDSEIDGGPYDLSSMSNGNITAIRMNIHGGHNGLECQEHSSHCTLQDSFIHNQYDPHDNNAHIGGALIMAGNNITFQHNTVWCESTTGCTGDINLIPYYDPPTVFYITGALIKHNLFVANANASYCTYGGTKIASHGTNIVYQDNIFQRGSNNLCGTYGPVTDFEFGNAGNVWTNNKWDNGQTVVCTAADECL